MDALSAILTDATRYLPTVDEEREVRLAVARSMSAILDNIVNPVLRDYPDLDVDEDSWGAIATGRARERLTSKI
jgi:hypothetical protein